MEENKEELEVLLFSSSNKFDIEQICGILKNNNIPFIKKEEGAGEYISLSMGQSIQEKKIFVSKDDYDKAILLIDSFRTDNTKVEDTDESSVIDKYKRMRHIYAWLFLSIPIVILIIVIMHSFINK